MVQPTRHLVCPVCESQFVAHGNRAKYCSIACKSWTRDRYRKGWRAARRPQYRECKTCQQPTPSLRHVYCSATCKPLRVRGGKTYAHPVDQHRECRVCGKEFTTRRVRYYCSDFCANRVVNADRFTDRLGRTCERCGGALPATHRLNRKFCTVDCQANFNQEIRRARRRGLPAERISRRRVFERDGWICQLCRAPINPELKGRDPMSASLDHVIPLGWPNSPGHVYGNVQAAHLKCNFSKGARRAA